MLLLLTNDDGIDSPGIEALERAVAGLGRTVVAAPDRPWSGCGHRLTVHDHIQVAERAPGHFAISGTPADCVRLGLQLLDARPDFVLSGINIGGNLGVDVFHSGTVAAAREAALQGVPSVALSHHKKAGIDFRWDEAVGWVQPVLEELLHEPLGPGGYWNVNLPCRPPGGAPPRTIRCLLDPSPMPLAYELSSEGYRYSGDYHDRPRRAGGDVDVCFRGDISVTLLGP